MLSVSDAQNVLNSFSSSYSSNTSDLLLLNQNLVKQKNILYQMIASGQTGSTVVQQTNLVNSIAAQVANKESYAKLLANSKSAAQAVLNSSSGVSVSNIPVNPFLGPTGPRGVQGDPGLMTIVGPTGPMGMSVTLDSTPQSGSTNLVSS